MPVVLGYNLFKMKGHPLNPRGKTPVVAECNLQLYLLTYFVCCTSENFLSTLEKGTFVFC